MSSLCEDFNKSISALISCLALKHLRPTGGALVIAVDDFQNVLHDLHDEFIQARENLERLERDIRSGVVATTSIVVGTSGALMKAQLQNIYEIGSPFGALVTDESFMPETGEC